MVSKSYLMKNYPELTVKPLKEIEKNDDFREQLGNSTQMSFIGLASWNVQVGNETNLATFDVPYLITSGEIEYSIPGFNAIRDIDKINNDTRMFTLNNLY